MADRIHDGLIWLAGEFSATPDEFRKAMSPGGDMLLTGLHTHGFVNHDRQHDRYAVSEAGSRRLADMPPTTEAEA